MFRCPPTFRVFAAQNPLREGGGRKGLPRSFLNRFTRVAVESMGTADLEAVRLPRECLLHCSRGPRLIRSQCVLHSRCRTPAKLRGATETRAANEPSRVAALRRSHEPFARGA